MTALRYIAVVMTFVGAPALVLVAVGVYGVMACAVSERTQEIGVRIALGARGRDVLTLAFRRTLAITLAGLAAGLAAVLALARLLACLVFGVSATDAVTFTTGALLLAAVALLASYIPARRAMRVDPIRAPETCAPETFHCSNVSDRISPREEPPLWPRRLIHSTRNSTEPCLLSSSSAM